MFIVLVATLIISGILLTGSIMLMSPKGGVGLGIGGMSGNNEYGSKKSLETQLKKIATVCSIVFVLSALLLPYSQ